MAVEGQATQLHAEASLGADVHGYAQPEAGLVQPWQRLQPAPRSDLVLGQPMYQNVLSQAS